MTSTVSVAEPTKHIGEFSDLMTSDVKKHFKEYIFGIIAPS